MLFVMLLNNIDINYNKAISDAKANIQIEIDDNDKINNFEVNIDESVVSG